MGKLQNLRLLSILCALAIGFWLPIRVNGFVPNVSIEILFDLLMSCLAGLNLYLYFQTEGRDYRQIRSWLKVGLLLDLFCLLPLQLVSCLVNGVTDNWLLFINLAAARHVRQIKPFLDTFGSLQPIAYRIIPVVVTMPLLVHLLACSWIAMGSGTAGPDGDPLFVYVRAIYWAFTTLTTVGYGDISAKTIPQMLFTCGVQVLGVGVFGYILSNVASVLSRSDADREHHMDNLDRIETYMRLHKIPPNLSGKVREYYHYLWETKKGYQDHKLIEDLPIKIQSELFLQINRSIVEKVPFLQGATPDLLEDLMNELEPRIFVPGEKIFRINERGHALYLIHQGQVEILTGDNDIIATLGEGAFFGEMALISERPRSATARASTFCDAYVLERDAFEKVTTAYPEFRMHLERVVKERQAS